MSRSAPLAARPAGVAGNALGAALLVVAWWGSSGEVRFADQLGWVSLGITGLLVALVADVAVVVAERRRIAGRRGTLRGAPATRRDPVGPTTPAVVLAAAAGARRYHRDDCSLVVGKPVVELRPGTDLLPCGMCRP